MIYLDIDGTLGDHRALHIHAATHLNIPIDTHQVDANRPERGWYTTEEHWEAAHQWVMGHLMDMGPTLTEEDLDNLEDLAGRHRLIALTAREGTTLVPDAQVRDMTREWLAAQYPMISGIIFDKNKTLPGLLVDDSPMVAARRLPLGLPTILVDAPYNRGIEGRGITRVRGTWEAVHHLWRGDIRP